MDSPGIPMAVRKFVMMRTHRIPMRVPQHAAPLPAVMDSPSQTVQIILQAQAMMSSVIVVPITLPIRIAAAPVANFPGAAVSSLILCSTRVVMMDHRMACRSNAMHSVMESLLHSAGTVSLSKANPAMITPHVREAYRIINPAIRLYGRKHASSMVVSAMREVFPMRVVRIAHLHTAAMAQRIPEKHVMMGRSITLL